MRTLVLLCSCLSAFCTAGFVGMFGTQSRGRLGVGKRWPLPVLYDFNAGLSAREEGLIGRAMGEIQAKSCVAFLRRQEGPSTGLVVFTRLPDQEDRCQSNVGRQRGWNEIRLSGRCFTKIGYVLHEILHALGFLHEHQRPDRGDYIRLSLEEIKPERRAQFKAVRKGRALTPYDPYSVMHYHPKLFSRRGRRTFEWVYKGRAVEALIGQKERLSPGDVAALNSLYCTS